MVRREGVVAKLIELAEQRGTVTTSEAVLALFGPDAALSRTAQVASATYRGVQEGLLARAGRGCFRLATRDDATLLAADKVRRVPPDIEDDEYRDKPRKANRVEVEARLNRMAMGVNFFHDELTQLRRELRLNEPLAEAISELGGFRDLGDSAGGPRLKLSRWGE